MSVCLICFSEFTIWIIVLKKQVYSDELFKTVGTSNYIEYKKSSQIEEMNNYTIVTVTVTTVNDSVQGTSVYIPKGYSVAHIILTSIVLSIIMFVIVFGNLLVVIAIFTDKTLKTTQNLFIASLAVADFLLGIIIMPFSLANEMMGYWYFGRVWCDLWKAIDVLLCTASILSICLISLDRYWSITRAIAYSRNRTPRRAALMIAAVWFLSAIICVPPLIGWKNPLPVTDYPLCLLSDDIGYVLYSTMGSFYIPCIIMVFVYFKIYRAARRLARKNIRKKQITKQITVEVKDHTATEFPSVLVDSSVHCSPITSELECKKVIRKPQLESVKETEYKAINATDIRSGIKAGRGDNNKPLANLNINQGLKYQVINSSMTETHDYTTAELTRENSVESEQCGSPTLTHIPTPTYEHTSKSEQRRLSMQKISEKFKMKRPRCNGNKSTKGWRAASLREHERHKRKIAKARERRATIVLGLVMAAFILCWFPFFTLYIITSFCYCVGEIVFTVVFWAGYCNSALNPIIYTVFNREFRHAFHRIICKKRLR